MPEPKLKIVAPEPFKVEAGVPFHDPKRRGGPEKGPYRLALEALAAGEIGASFFVPDGAFKQPQTAHRIAQSLFGPGWCRWRKVDGGQRVWKIAEPKLRA